jgi:Flp pilus assembly pilin Flp
MGRNSVRVVRSLAGDDRGQDLLEYALLSALVGIIALATINTLGVTMGTVYSAWNSAVNGLWEPPPPPG